MSHDFPTIGQALARQHKKYKQEYWDYHKDGENRGTIAPGYRHYYAFNLEGYLKFCYSNFYLEMCEAMGVQALSFPKWLQLKVQEDSVTTTKKQP